MLAFFLAGICGCAHYPVNLPIDHINLNQGYRAVTNVRQNSEKLSIVLTLSGGGTRAAAFSTGVLEELAHTTIRFQDRQRRLLDEVDTISCLSGSCFPAAYYGLYGDRVFTDFDRAFLKRNVEAGLITAVFLNPVNWWKLASPYYGRSEVAAAYYDKIIFHGATIKEFIGKDIPFIFINATDITNGTVFPFNQDFFDAICSDVSEVPISRAIAASSAIQGLLTPMTFRNYAGRCNSRLIPMLEQMLGKYDRTTRAHDSILRMEQLANSKDRPFLHILDGGIGDSLGIRSVLRHVFVTREMKDTLGVRAPPVASNILFIVVDAHEAPNLALDRREKAPSIADTFYNTFKFTLDQYNFETFELLKNTIEQLEDKTTCKDVLKDTKCGEINFYLALVDFDGVADKGEQAFLKTVRANFNLNDRTVDRLRAAGRIALKDSKEFQRFLREISEPPTTPTTT